MRDWPTATAGWFKRLFDQVTGSPRGAGAEGEGVPTLATGGSAVLATEARTCDAICRTRGASGASEEAPEPNLFGRTVTDFRAGGARAVFAGTSGFAGTGRRAAAFLPGDRLAEVHDQLFAAAGRHLPLIVHASNRAMPRQTSARGSGHEGYHAVADSGAFLLMPRNAQEAVDLALVARRVAELGLVPGVVAVDGPEITWAPQDLLLPTPDLMRAIVGAPDETVECPTEAQQMVFGRERRRLPSWVSATNPVAIGVAQNDDDFAAAMAGQRAFFAADLPGLVDDALAEVSGVLDRPLATVHWHGPRDADHVFVAQGSLAEAASAAVDALARTRGDKFAVLSVVWLRPFPVSAISDALGRARTVTVLERVDDSLASAPPLTREIAGLIDRGRQTLHTAMWGAGGQPVRVADLVWLGGEMRGGMRLARPITLGLSATSGATDFPRREARTTAIARSFPALSESCGRAPNDEEPPREGTRTVVLVAPAAEADDTLAVDLAKAVGGEDHPHVRARVAVDSEGIWHGRVCAAQAGAAAGAFAAGADVLLFDALDLPPGRNPFRHVVRGGVVVLGGAFGAEPWGALHPAWRETIEERGLRLTRVDGNARALVTAVATYSVAGLRDAPRVETDEATETWDRTDEPSLPFIVRQIVRNDTHYDNPARAWGEVVQPLVAGESPVAAPDPFLTVGAVPPGTSTFHDGSPGRMQLPVIDPAACTGCGRCWTVCPDSALAPIAIGTQALLDAAAARAGTSGPAADRLRRAHKHLAGRADKLIAAGDASTVGGALSAGYDWLVPQIDVPDDELEDTSAAFAATVSAFEALPLAVTEPFFAKPHGASKGSGALLGIALNPQACKGCGGCGEACADDAIHITRQTGGLVVAASEGWRVWEDLPDPDGPRIEAAASEIGTSAAALLSRHCSMAIAGGDAAEPGSGARLAVRLTLAAAEETLQKRHLRLQATLADVEKQVRAELESSVTSAIHVDDLAAVEGALDGANDAVDALEAVVRGLGEAGATDRIDTERIGLLAGIARRVAAERIDLVEGPNGLGRARIALVVADGAETDWAVRYPYNPFAAPVVTAMAEDAPELAAGTQSGLLDDTVGLARLVAHARTVVDRPKDLAERTAAAEAMTWSGVPDEIADGATHVLLVGGATALLGRGLPGVIALLRSDLPVRILVLDEHDPSFDAPDPVQLAMMQPNAFAASTSSAWPDHLHTTVQRAFAHSGPSIVHVHAPSPRRHGYPSEKTVPQARLCTLSRVHPLAVYDPTADGVFGQRLEIGDNPQADAEFAVDGSGEPLTIARWAEGESRFRPGGSAAADLSTFATERLRHWEVLREVSGTTTPFTSDVRARVETEVAADQASREAALKAEYAQAIAALEAEHTQAHAAQLRDRFLQIAGYAPAPARPAVSPSDTTGAE